MNDKEAGETKAERITRLKKEAGQARAEAYKRLKAEIKELFDRAEGPSEAARCRAVSKMLGGSACGWSAESVRVRISGKTGDLPQGKSLWAFCRATGIRADYILFKSQPKRLEDVGTGSWQADMATWVAEKMGIAWELDGARIAAFLLEGLRASEAHDHVRDAELLPQFEMAQELLHRGSDDDEDVAKWTAYAEAAQQRMAQHSYLGMLRRPVTRVITRRVVDMEAVTESQRTVRETRLVDEPIPKLNLTVACDVERPARKTVVAPKKRRAKP